jgi:homoserine acetyltransferase
MGTLKLESEEVIQDFVLSYVTHGTLNTTKSNAILLATALGGNHHRLDFLIGPGRALDPSKYFIIATDAIGNGLTTSPSTSKTQPRMQFPKFTIRDMVRSQHQLVTEHFGITKLVTVIGASMGACRRCNGASVTLACRKAWWHWPRLAVRQPGPPEYWRCCARALWLIQRGMAATTPRHQKSACGY